MASWLSEWPRRSHPRQFPGADLDHVDRFAFAADEHVQIAGQELRVRGIDHGTRRRPGRPGRRPAVPGTGSWLIDSAALAPIRGRHVGSFSRSALNTVAMICTSL